MASCKFLLLLGPAVLLCGASAGADPAKPAPARFSSARPASPLPQGYLDAVAGAQSRVDEATGHATGAVDTLKQFLVEQRDAHRRGTAAKKELTKHLKKARLALASLKAGPKPESAASTLAETKLAFEAAQNSADQAEGEAFGTAAAARQATVAIQGDDEFRGLVDHIATGKELTDALTPQADALPANQRERGRSEITRLRKELAKASAGLVKARQLERDLLALVLEAPSAADKSEITKGLAEVEALSKRGSATCDLHRIDWKNQRYPDDSATFALKNGAGRAKWGNVTLSDVLYVDLDANGTLEAVVTLAEDPPEPEPDTGNAMCNWEGRAQTYVFSAGAGCKPALLGTFTDGTMASRKAGTASVVVEAPYFTLAATESRCFPSGLKRVTWRLSSGKLTSSSVKVR